MSDDTLNNIIDSIADAEVAALTAGVSDCLVPSLSFDVTRMIHRRFTASAMRLAVFNDCFSVSHNYVACNLYVPEQNLPVRRQISFHP
jgi:hypothetical protein